MSVKESVHFSGMDLLVTSPLVPVVQFLLKSASILLRADVSSETAEKLYPPTEQLYSSSKQWLHIGMPGEVIPNIQVQHLDLH